MSISGAVMILVTIVIRSLFLHRLPKRTFTVMWGIVMARLLLPYSLPSAFSVYSLLSEINSAEQAAGNIMIPSVSDIPTGETANTPELPAAVPTVNYWMIAWFIGALACFVFFTVSYIKCLRRFGESLPVDNEYIGQWLSEHRLCRRISVRQSDQISMPLTYGVFRPVILLPKKWVQYNTNEMKYVLSHEYLHIRRFDAVFKLVLTTALCVHWFNPLVWVMYIIANRDIEISCDEAVIRMLGEREKSDYAMTLIRMKEKANGLAPLINHYNKNAIEERIVTIMKFKKTTALTVAAAVCLVIGTTAAFATSAQTLNSDSTQQIGDVDETPTENKASEDVSDKNDIPDVSPTPAETEETLPTVDKVENSNDISSDYDLKSEADYIGWENMPKGSNFSMIIIDGVPYFFLIDITSWEPAEDIPYNHEKIVDGAIIRWYE